MCGAEQISPLLTYLEFFKSSALGSDMAQIVFTFFFYPIVGFDCFSPEMDFISCTQVLNLIKKKISIKKNAMGEFPSCAAEMNPTRNHEVVGSIPALISGLRIWCCLSCGEGCRLDSDPVLLWLWRRLEAVALIRLPSLGTSICHRCGREKTKYKINRQINKNAMGSFCCGSEGYKTD